MKLGIGNKLPKTTHNTQNQEIEVPGIEESLPYIINTSDICI